MSENNPDNPQIGFRVFLASVVLALTSICLFMAAMSNSLTKGNNLGNQLASLAVLTLIASGLTNVLALAIGINEIRHQGRFGFWFVLNAIGTASLIWVLWMTFNL
jgi:hypothetical protein